MVVEDASLCTDSVGCNDGFELVMTGKAGRGFDDVSDDILIEPIDTPLLVVTSSN